MGETKGYIFNKYNFGISLTNTSLYPESYMRFMNSTHNPWLVKGILFRDIKCFRFKI